MLPANWEDLPANTDKKEGKSAWWPRRNCSGSRSWVQPGKRKKGIRISPVCPILLERSGARSPAIAITLNLEGLLSAMKL